MENYRSWMFVPGHIGKMVDKALGTRADAVMLDLEDAVLPSSKPQAREVVAAALLRAPSGPARFVRINAIGQASAVSDLDAVVQPGLEGIVVPKVEAVEQIHEAERMLIERERRAGSTTPMRILAAIESATGLLRAPAIAAASKRVCGLMLGAEDLSKDIGLPIRREAEAYELLYARSALVMAAAAARVQAIDQVWTDIRDIEGLRRDALQARRLGFTGKSIIHPGQIDPVNDAFSPNAEDVEFARKVIDAFRDAEARGLGAVAFGGQLLDKPIVDRAHATLAMAQRLERQQSWVREGDRDGDR
jgi:citrate lyase subunit beta/citryl-CoA lyase